MNNNYVLYLHIAPNGKKYFGITGMKPEYRWSNGNGYKNNKHFIRAITKYGWDNIQHIILTDKLTKEEACFFEQVMIALYDTTNRNNGYNNSTGGEGGNSGCERTKEWGQKISKAKKGIPTGYHHTEETKKKLSDYRTGKYCSIKNPHSKSVVCLTTKRIFFTTKEGANYYNTYDSSISACCKGKKKSSGKLSNNTKLVWRYLNYKHNKTYHIAGGYLVDNEKMAKLIEESFGQTLSDEEIALLIEDIFPTDESIDYENIPDII